MPAVVRGAQILWVALALVCTMASKGAAQKAPTRPGACDEAEDDPLADEFRMHYKRSTDLYRAQRFSEAIPEMQMAYQLKPVSRLLYNIGQAHRKLRQPREAITYFELYLRTDTRISPEVRAEIDGFLAEMRALAEEQERARILLIPKVSPPPRWLRPLGGTLLGLGLGGIAASVPLFVLDGNCVADPVPPATVCDKVYSTRTPAGVLIGVGGALGLTGAIIVGLALKKTEAAAAPIQLEKKKSQPAFAPPPPLPPVFDPEYEPPPAPLRPSALGDR